MKYIANKGSHFPKDISKISTGVYNQIISSIETFIKAIRLSEI